MFLQILFLLVSVVLANSEYIDYRNHKVYKVTPQSENDVKVLIDIEKKYEYLFWNEYEYIKVGSDLKIQVAPAKQQKFEKHFSEIGIKATLLLEDVQRFIDEQASRPAAIGRNVQDYAWDYYQTLDEIYEWMEVTAAAYPDVASIVTIGTTYEERPIKGMVIHHSRGSNKVYGFIEGGLHAREWISPATATWIMKEFLTSNDPAIRAMAEDVVWHIFPVTNPDGYVYSFTDNRMWRKNRNPANFTSCAHLGISDDFSIGIDLNRNFDFKWNVFEDNSDPCEIVFAGPTPFSEFESVAIANHITSLQARGTVLYYLSYHSFTQLLLLPHSHNGGGDVLGVGNYGDLFEIGVKGMDKLTARHNTPYTVGTVPKLFPGARAGGLGFDWARGVANITMSFLFELRDLGEFGFLLPPHNIIPNNEEVMDGMAEMHQYVKRLGYFRSAANTFSSYLMIVIMSMFVMVGLH